MSEGTTVSWGDLLAEAADALAADGIERAALEARWLLEEASGAEPGELDTHPGTLATVGTVQRLRALLARRRSGEPLQRVLGHWPFRRLDLLVDGRALVPRPETETVVEVALAELDALAASGSGVADRRAVDLGTGTGAIALSIAVERPGLEVWATDASAEAVALARANLAGLGLAGSGVRVVQGDWFDALPSDLEGAVDLMVSNPPYVAAGEVLPAEVADWDPPRALVAGPTGRECLEHLLDGAGRWLAPDGVVVVELAPHQAEALAERSTGHFEQVDVRCDLAGRDRVLVARGPRRQRRPPSVS